jgi:molybdopterin molybdotransferase
MPEKEPMLGEVRDINSCALKALAVKNGYNVLSSHVLGDNEEQLEAVVSESTVSCDIILISGGSSQGEKDFTAAIIDRIVTPGVFTHGLAVKPGKPTILGWDEKTKTLLVGLPGHPVSAIMVFELLFSCNFQSIEANISCNVPGSPGRSVCQPVTLELKDGVYSAFPVFGKAGLISTLTEADGFIIIDLNKEGLQKDETVQVHLF